MMNFQVLGLAELIDQFDKAGTQGKITVNEGLREIGRIFVPSKGTGPLAKETPKRTGKLRKSTIFEVVGGPAKQQLEIRQGARSREGAFYGFFVREGTKPHVIRPKRARMLRFEIDGRVVYARKVNHPGTDPNPYHKRVFDREQGKVQDVVNKMGTAITSILSGESV